uniref:Essential protein Yae1 N-terminal domain-containing protein n=1 Tax=Eubacterium plexicaudatum ASF492 TaxID=1235802 RepID=N2BF21_9FIRM
MIAEKDPYIKSTYDQLQIISQDKEKRMEYEAREKAIRDHNQFLLEAEQRGMEKGMEEGMKKGMEKGMEEGRKLEAIAIARNMKKENFPDARIVRSTGLSASEVANL